MKRFLALMGAAAMILAAVVIRGAMTGEGPGGRSGRDQDSPIRLLCATALRDACKELDRLNDIEVTFEDPGATVDRLVAAKDAGKDAGFDAWLVIGPWDQILTDNLRFAKPSRKSPLGDAGPVLGRSPAVVVTINDKARTAARQVCPDGIDLACASTPNSLSIGLAAPDRGDGLIPLTGAVSTLLGTDDFSTQDLESTQVNDLISALAESSRKGRFGDSDPLGFAITWKGQFDMVGVLEAEAARYIADRPELEVHYPAAVAVAEVRLVHGPGVDSDSVSERLDDSAISESLAKAGWRVGGEAPRGLGNAPQIPDGDGLPAPGVLQVLREAWSS